MTTTSPRFVTGERDRDRERDRDADRRDRRLVRHARDDEPQHGHRQREHGKITSITPAPVATPRPPLNFRVTGSMCPRMAATPRMYAPAVAVDGEADAGGERALGDVEGEHEHAGLPPEQPEGVRGARVARALGGDVDAPPARHERPRSGTSRAGRPRAPGVPTSTPAFIARPFNCHRGSAPHSVRGIERRCGRVSSRVDRVLTGRPGRIRERSVMPTYVYECAKCGDEFEVCQSFTEDPLKKHPGCGGKVAKVFQPVGIVLKGSGFYKNDSRNGAKSSGKRARPRTATGLVERVEVGQPTKSESDVRHRRRRAPDTAPASKSRDNVELTKRDAKPSTPAPTSPRRSPLPRPSFPDHVRGDTARSSREGPAMLRRSPRALALCGRSRSSSRWSPPRSSPPTSPPPPARRRPRTRASTRSSPPATCRSAPRSTRRDLDDASRAPRPSSRGVRRRPRRRSSAGSCGAGAARRLRRRRATRAAPPHGLDGVGAAGHARDAVVVTDALRPRAGAAVDVLATFDPRAAGEQRRCDATTVVVAAGVRCSRIDRRGGATAHAVHGTAGVTLLVDAEQAARARRRPGQRRRHPRARAARGRARTPSIRRACPSSTPSSSGSSRACPSSCRSRRAAT